MATEVTLAQDNYRVANHNSGENDRPLPTLKPAGRGREHNASKKKTHLGCQTSRSIPRAMDSYMDTDLLENPASSH